jgi:predicted dehydrogenase
MKTVNIAIIGTRFMGKAHSNAWSSAPKFFPLSLMPVMKVACDLDPRETTDFANNWGWQAIETDWRKVVKRSDVDVIDICTPSYLHHEIAIAAAQNGKHIFCEKPIALTYGAAREMYAAAEKAGVLHYLNHNYRRVPAVAFARRLIEEGKIGRIYHWRGAYLQDWITDPSFPLTWHLRKESAGAGPQFDLNSHSVDLARYLVGLCLGPEPEPFRRAWLDLRWARSQLKMLPSCWPILRTAHSAPLKPAVLRMAARTSIPLRSTAAKEA